MRVGFIGLGSQGAPIAARIAASGRFETRVWARRAEALSEFLGGPAMIAKSIEDVAKDVDVLITCVFDATGTREVLFGAGGAASVMAPGTIVVCHSTLLPNEITDISVEAAERHGLRMLDAPVSGGGPKAAVGELVVMVGGDPTTLAQAQPVIDTYSTMTVHLGPVGAGQQAKLLNNALLAAHIGLAHDAFSLARRLGMDGEALGQLLATGSGRSYGLELMSRAGSLAALARPPLQPTLTKDVDLFFDLVGDAEAGAQILEPASALIDALAQATATPA